MIPYPWLILAALALEAAAGYPAWLHRIAPHPVVWIGKMIEAMERAWNRDAWSFAKRRALGVLCVLILLMVAGGAGLAIQLVPLPETLRAGLFIALASIGLAQRSLFDHVRAVQRALTDGDLDAARSAVSMIVGRDVASLDNEGVAAAAIESLAESFNDAVMAPAFWLALAGLPGLFAYKAVNTGDSMIGHMEPRWRAFGWAAARTDDLMNMIPARLAGMLVCLAGGGGFRVMLCDAGKHASPNSGWPEAAMAGALKISLGGPATYDGAVVERPRFGNGPSAGVADLGRGLQLYVRACGILWALILVGGFPWVF